MQWKSTNLLGKRAYFLDENGRASGDWGRIVGYDGEYYHIAFADDENNVLIFRRNEFKVGRNQS